MLRSRATKARDSNRWKTGAARTSSSSSSRSRRIPRSSRSASGSCSNSDARVDRHDGERARSRLPPADQADARAWRRRADHRTRLRPDAAAARAARALRRGDRPPRRAVAGAEGPADDASPRRAEEVGEGTRLRRRPRARLPRADADRAPARHPELDDVRLRVRDAPAPARLPRGDEGRRPRRDPGEAARAVRRAAAEARAVPGAQGGVLPLRLSARPLAARTIRCRVRPRARRVAPTTRRLALPPPLEPALPDDARSPRPARERACVRAAANRGAARVRTYARPTVGDPPRAGRRRAEPDRARRPRRLRR